MGGGNSHNLAIHYDLNEREARRRGSHHSSGSADDVINSTHMKNESHNNSKKDFESSKSSRKVISHHRIPKSMQNELDKSKYLREDSEHLSLKIEQQSDSKRYNDKNISKITQRLIKYALTGLNISFSNMRKHILSNMERIECNVNDIIIKKGDIGDKLYVIESGLVHVIDDNNIVLNVLGPGQAINDNALLYNVPYTKTKKCVTKCIIWCLPKRFLLQVIDSDHLKTHYIRRGRWLVNIPEFSRLPASELSILIYALSAHTFEAGDVLYKQGEVTNRCILITSGKAIISADTGDNADKTIDIEKYHIIRPPYVTPLDESTEWPSQRLHSAAGVKPLVVDATPSLPVVPTPEGASAEGEEVEARPLIHESSTELLPVLSDTERKARELYEGTFIGLGILRGKARIPGSWPWNLTVRDEEDALEVGAVSPITVVATERVEALTFTVNIFENLFGDIDLVNPNSTDTKALFTHNTASKQPTLPPITPLKFKYSHFKQTYILGSGNYGVVSIGEFLPTPDIPSIEGIERGGGGSNSGSSVLEESTGNSNKTIVHNNQYALKALSKSDVIEMGQVRHALDEAKLLGKLLLYCIHAYICVLYIIYIHIHSYYMFLLYVLIIVYYSYKLLLLRHYYTLLYIFRHAVKSIYSTAVWYISNI